MVTVLRKKSVASIEPNERNSVYYDLIGAMRDVFWRVNFLNRPHKVFSELTGSCCQAVIVKNAYGPCRCVCIRETVYGRIQISAALPHKRNEMNEVTICKQSKQTLSTRVWFSKRPKEPNYPKSTDRAGFPQDLVCGSNGKCGKMRNAYRWKRKKKRCYLPISGGTTILMSLRYWIWRIKKSMF